MTTSTVPINNALVALTTVNIDANGVSLQWSATMTDPNDGSALSSQELVFWTTNGPPSVITLGPSQNTYTFTKVSSGLQYHVELIATFANGAKYRYDMTGFIMN